MNIWIVKLIGLKRCHRFYVLFHCLRVFSFRFLFCNVRRLILAKTLLVLFLGFKLCFELRNFSILLVFSNDHFSGRIIYSKFFMSLFDCHFVLNHQFNKFLSFLNQNKFYFVSNFILLFRTDRLFHFKMFNFRIILSRIKRFSFIIENLGKLQYSSDRITKNNLKTLIL